MPTFKVKNPLWIFKNSFAPNVRVDEFNTYIGEVVPNPKWVPSDRICISTGDAGFPFRVVDRSRVVEISGVPQTEATNRPVTQTFEVAGSKGNSYTVVRHGERWTCSCPAFSFRRECKHINKLVAEKV